jgi:cell division protein FtsB
VSPAAATAARAARATSPARRTGPARAPRRPNLRVVTPVPSRAPRAPFVLFSMLLVGAGLVSLLLLNTAVAQDAFLLHDLDRQNAALAEREQLLRQEVAALEAPGAVAERAGSLGLVPAGDPVFLTADGRVLGNPVPAAAPPPPPLAPVAPVATARPTAAPSAAAGSPTAKPGASAAAKPTAQPSPRASARPTPRPSGTP